MPNVLTTDSALDRAPHLNKTRITIARAYKSTGRYEAAANLLFEAYRMEPDNELVCKLTAAAMNQAGEKETANALYHGLIQRRRDRLPDDIVSGFQALEQSSVSASIPQKRLDWAWSMRDHTVWKDRDVWDKRAKWGFLADKLLYDWLECQPDRIQDVLPLLHDLSSVEKCLWPIAEKGKGLIIASAHIGLMFAGPLMLELIGLQNKWLASVPSLPSVGFSNQLISTADQTEGQVVRQSIKALSAGKVVTIAVDGTMSNAAPRVDLAGKRVTYSSFAARLSLKQRVPAVFAVPRWEAGAIRVRLRTMPHPETIDDPQEFLDQWRATYLGYLADMMRDAPENLRLSGGIWRDVK